MTNDQPLITVCLCLYGPYYPLHKRCLEGIVTHTQADKYSMRIGMNDVSNKTRALVHSLEGVSLLVDSERNIAKYPMMRKLMHNMQITSSLVAWFDDDSYPVGDWVAEVEQAFFKDGATVFGAAPRSQGIIEGGFWAAADDFLKATDWPPREYRQEHADDTLAQTAVAAGKLVSTASTQVQVGQYESRGLSPRVIRKIV